MAVLVWWLVLQATGLLALPITLKLLRFLPDRGVGLARQVGLLLSGYLFWLLVSLGVLRNTTPNILLVWLLIGAISVYLWLQEGQEMLASLRRNRPIIWATELVFALSLVGFALFRAYNPDIAATEKPMEFGFINAILRSRAFPPRDPWLAGYSISYYYLGYVISAMLTRLSGLPSDVTFNLVGVTLFALTANGAFSLVSNMVRATAERREAIKAFGDKVATWPGILSGLLGATLVALIGNLEGVFELLRARGLGSEALFRWLDIKNLAVTPPSAHWYPDDMWWWWRASRVIHDRDLAGQSLEVIDEFPFFSFLLGDNHPHVLALPVVFLALALALNLLLWQVSPRSPKARTERAGDEKARGWSGRLWKGLQELWPGSPWDWALWALLLGSFGFMNTWDYPIYLGIFVLAYAIWNQARRPIGLDWLADVLLTGILLLVAGLVFYLPFYLGFRSQAGGLGMVGPIKTRLHQYLIMMGIPLWGAASLVVVSAAEGLRRERRVPFPAQLIAAATVFLTLFSGAQGWWTAALAFFWAGAALALLVWGTARREEEGRPWLPPSSALALLSVVVGLLLTGSVEFVFLRDTFGTRMNTVFKFYYQAWVLLGIAAAYGSYQVVERLRTGGLGARAGLALWSLVGGLLLAAGLSYTVAAIAAKTEGFSTSPTLDGTRYIAQWRPDDYAAVQWLREHAPLDAVMLEAPGGSYSEYNWVSAHTGIPTLLGWGGHELQWRGNYDIPGQREPDIQQIYQSPDVEATRRLLKSYGIDYVYLGRLERQKYAVSPAVVQKFDRLMERVFEQGSVTLYGFTSPAQ
ncbi:MAG: hypothetical protein H5T69_09995 [Chloroflexi bacterium]|nr:hypothetical protein [Chloroflexota bacterium]